MFNGLVVGIASTFVVLFINTFLDTLFCPQITQEELEPFILSLFPSFHFVAETENPTLRIAIFVGTKYLDLENFSLLFS